MQKYNADRAVAVANLNNYLTSAAGVAEHPNVVGEMDKLVAQISEADGKLATLKLLLETGKPSNDKKPD